MSHTFLHTKICSSWGDEPRNLLCRWPAAGFQTESNSITQGIHPQGWYTWKSHVWLIVIVIMIHQAAKNPWNCQGSHNPKPSCVVSSYCITVLDTHTHTYIYIYHISVRCVLFLHSSLLSWISGDAHPNEVYHRPRKRRKEILVKSAMPWRTHCLFLCALPPVIVNSGQVRSAVFLLITCAGATLEEWHQMLNRKILSASSYFTNLN